MLINRIAKSAMSENCGTYSNAPTKTLINAYAVWAKGNPGLLITGNIMVDSKALGEPRNVVVEDYTHFEQLKQWAKTVEGTGVHLWPQLNHPGRQAFASINKKIVAPSAVPLKMGGASKMFRTATPLTEDEIWDIIKRFGNAARILKEAGFTGKSNLWGTWLSRKSVFIAHKQHKRRSMGRSTGKSRQICFGSLPRNKKAKGPRSISSWNQINSNDFQCGFAEEESMEVVQILSREGIDLIEISGGTYEKPAMVKGSRK